MITRIRGFELRRYNDGVRCMYGYNFTHYIRHATKKCGYNWGRSIILKNRIQCDCGVIIPKKLLFIYRSLCSKIST